MFERQFFIKSLRERRGAALLAVLGVSAVLIPLIQGIFLDSQREYRSARQRMNRLQARYNAQSGLSMGILRVCVFKGLESAIPQQWQAMARPLMDRIWSFPFMQPFSLPEGLFQSDRQTVRDLKKKSFFKGSFTAVVKPEDGLLDINNLVSSLVSRNRFTQTALASLLDGLLEDQPELKGKYSPADIDEITIGLSRGMDKNAVDGIVGEDGKKPLKRSFASVEEIKKAEGVTKEIFDILSPHVTVYGSGALNVNYISRAVWEKSFHFPPDMVDHILARTQQSSPFYSPFLDERAFCDFMEELGFSFCDSLKEDFESLDVLDFSPPTAFRIQSVGRYRNSAVHLEALLSDLSSQALSYQKALYRQKQRQAQKQQQAEEEGGNQDLSTGSPPSSDLAGRGSSEKGLKFNYSYAKSLIIMYLKEES